MAPLQPTFRLAQSFADEHIRQPGDFRGGLRQGGDLQHIAQHDPHVLAPLEPRQH